MVGEKITSLTNKSALLSDISTIITLISASVLGMPVSTTHVKTISIASISYKSINISSIKKIIVAWILTFPVCGIISYGFMKMFIKY